MKLGVLITVLAQALTHTKFSLRQIPDIHQGQNTTLAPQVAQNPQFQAPQVVQNPQIQAPQVHQPQAAQNLTQAAELLVQQLNQKNNELKTQQQAPIQQAVPNLSQENVYEAINSILQKTKDSDFISKVIFFIEEQMEQIFKYNITAKEVKTFMGWLQTRRFKRLHRKIDRHHRKRRQVTSIQQTLNISAHEVKEFIQWLQTRKARKGRLSIKEQKVYDVLQNQKTDHRKLSHARKSRKNDQRKSN